MKFVFTKSKFRALSTLCANFSAVFFASLVIPIFFGGIDISKIPVLLFGVVATFIFAWLSLIFAEKGKL